MNQELIDRIMKIVSRAPSPHNTQPVKWRFLAHRIQLLIVHDRVLWVSDKTLRDLHLSAGAAFYLLKLALREEGFEIEETRHYRPTFTMKEEIYLEVTLKTSTAEPQREVELLTRHACYRGNFKSGDAPLKFSNPHVHVMSDDNGKKQLASLYDEATAFFLGKKDYAEELWSWLRLDRRDPKFHEDGLNADMLRLGGIMTALSRVVMKPQTLARLDKLKLIPVLITEASQNKSAEAIVALVKDHQKNFFEEGQDLMRLWLEIEAQGRVLCPITALIDDPAFEAKVKKILHTDEPIVHIVRVGVKPEKEELELSPRLPLKKLFLRG